jgi:predicted DNA binding CopG/RHH family protein
VKEKMFHLSINIALEVIKNAKIQVITEGMNFQAWITQAIIRQLAVLRQEPPKGAV